MININLLPPRRKVDVWFPRARILIIVLLVFTGLLAYQLNQALEDGLNKMNRTVASLQKEKAELLIEADQIKYVQVYTALKEKARSLKVAQPDWIPLLEMIYEELPPLGDIDEADLKNGELSLQIRLFKRSDLSIYQERLRSSPYLSQVFVVSESLLDDGYYQAFIKAKTNENKGGRP